jgi:hypothetical protein
MIKGFLRWFVPPGFRDLLRSLKNWCQVKTVALAPLQPNESLRNRHRDRPRCFVLATGPSIGKQNLAPLEGETCIAVSNFFVHPEFARIQPQYYCIPKLCFPPLTREDGVRWFRDIDAHIGKTTLFLALGDKKYVEQNGLFAGRTVHYVAHRTDWSDVGPEGIDLTRPVPKIQSSPLFALQIALFMGFTEIYLLGCDHDWILNLGVSRHFYPESLHAVVSRPGYSEWGSIEEESRNYAMLWQQYGAIRRYCEARGVKIYNATAGGLLNVFERVEFESLFQKGGSTAGGK